MAAERAKNPGVKAFGRMMVQDQSQTNRELAQIAAQLSILPSQQLDLKHQYLADRLSAAQGAEFDREYLKAMVEGHEEVLNKLEMRASQDGSALAEWATRMQPKVQQHLDRARQLQQQLAR